ncbi:protein kinase [Pseudacidovorax sp. RU35E]|uniref:protein kinase domain-containing protein n=1 Tax=Pseudacidovorax sp. RU35E TaxID=1907403 RepID=UPI0009554E24|nr:protein kinase [Pseudacidovorax sp. RU35E]SIR51318.1 Serine/threonine protein kinase [Pseudacidovorax sp. RU35E]
MTHATAPARSPGTRKQLAVDDRGGIYELKKRIAQGGQGIVCPTQDARYLVKVSRFAQGDPRAQDWLRRIAAVQRMPIEENLLPIAMPVALITQPRPGYVMELMDGLGPMEDMLRQAQQQQEEGYIATGGLERRLRLLARLARVLAKLHGLGIAHGDLSPGNVFISNSIAHDQIWLIDCDNLTYAVRNSELQIYTPDYGAPEVFRGDRGISTYTDIWSFAVMAFQMLTLLHPFKSGQQVDQDSELEAAAFRGDIPWVDHDGDERNRALVGIPRDSVCTPALRALFRCCFQGGLIDPECRPGMAQWAEVLEAAVARVVRCEHVEAGCGHAFVWSSAQQCPFCGHSPTDANPVVVMDHLVYVHCALLGEDARPEDQWTRTGHVQVIGASPVPIRRSPPGAATYVDSQQFARVWIRDGSLIVEVDKGAELTLQVGKTLQSLRGQVALERRGARLALHLGPLEKPHGVWRLTW